jgi:hypothetical protein
MLCSLRVIVQAEPLMGTASAPTSEEPFLQSDLTRALVGPRSDDYAAKWTRMAEKSGGNLDKAARAISWNWAAFLFPFAWPFYRKLWWFGSLLLLGFLIVVLAPDEYEVLARGVGIAAGVVCGMLANGVYLSSIRRKWGRLVSMSDRARALAAASQEGGVSVGASALGVAALLAVSIAALATQEFL